METLGGIVGYCSAEETVLLNVSGLWEMMWACIILAGPMAIIVIHWDWIKGLFGDSFKLQTLAPELQRIRDEGITYADIDWIKVQLECIQIASPPRYGTIDVMPTDKIMDGPVRADWNHFLRQLVPLAQLGKVEQARKLSTSPTEVEAGPL